MSLQSFDAFRDGKVDFLIAYPFEYGYYARSAAVEKPYRTIRIRGFNPFATGYIACTKDSLGAQVITKVNEIADKQTGTYHWLTYYREWVSTDEWERVERFFARNMKVTQ